MKIAEILYAYYESQCLYAVAKLNVADHLQSGSKPITELAKLCGIDDEKLYRVMRFMAAKGLFDELENNVFCLNEHSQFLLSTVDSSLRDLVLLHGELFYQAASSISDGLQKNVIPFQEKFGQPVWKYLSGNPSANDLFHRAMKGLSEVHGEKIVKLCDFSSYKTVVDLGGGLGALLVKILLANPSLKGINFDLPSLQEEAEGLFQANKINDRCHYVGGSFYDGVPEGGDLYILKAILHGKPDDKVLPILNFIRDVLPGHGKVMIIDRVINRDENFVDACFNDMHMLSVSGGGDRTLQEFEDLLKKSNFRILQLIPIDASLMLIEAELSS